MFALDADPIEGIFLLEVFNSMIELCFIELEGDLLVQRYPADPAEAAKFDGCMREVTLQEILDKVEPVVWEGECYRPTIKRVAFYLDKFERKKVITRKVGWSQKQKKQVLKIGFTTENLRNLARTLQSVREIAFSIFSKTN